MNCAICRQGILKPGVATVTLEHEETTLVVKDVPAMVCETCGEEYVGEDVTAALLRTAAEAARTGVQVDVRSYVAA